MTIILYFNQDSLTHLIKEIDDKFWKIEEMELDNDVIKYYSRKQSQIKILVRFLVGLSYSTVVIFYFPVLVSGKNVLPFDAYQPPWLTLKQISFLQIFVAIFSVIPSLSAAMILLMTFCVLTQLQFRLLNIEIEKTLKKENVNFQAKLKQVVDHSSFLLR